MLEFRSKITVKVLGYFFLNPHRRHYINELAEILEADPGNLFRKLKELEQEGILLSEAAGNQKYFFLNEKYPLLKETKQIYNAKYGVANLLKEEMEKIKGLESAWIFGSFAKNSFQQESDIDLLLVGSHSSLSAKRLILPLEKKLGRELNIVDMTGNELKIRRKKKDEFIKNIFSQKTIKIF
ncbi:MAG: nucleotidyltransferase domain-containing protein [Candidatus Moranbacteria bacterium]|nr:nucleotidyltransferase domain-containing protein [Candidatus Moranbacteria bacterium]